MLSKEEEVALKILAFPSSQKHHRIAETEHCYRTLACLRITKPLNLVRTKEKLMQVLKANPVLFESLKVSSKDNSQQNNAKTDKTLIMK